MLIFIKNRSVSTENSLSYQILFLNKCDLFEAKVANSDIKNFFPDFDGEPGDARAGRSYFKKRFTRLAQKAGRSQEREVYVQ
jgi:guanine nucleotide-binding protein subunit alpha, other